MYNGVSKIVAFLGFILALIAGPVAAFSALCAIATYLKDDRTGTPGQIFVVAAATGGIAYGLFKLADVISSIPTKREEERRKLEEEEAERKRKLRQPELDREWKRQQEIAASEAHQKQQQQHLSTLESLCSQSLSLFESMPVSLLAVEQTLDQAEIDFQQSAFAPFWDSVEHAALRMAQFDGDLRSLSKNARDHADVSTLYEGTAPAFPIVLNSLTGIAAANTISVRMKAIVRTAQCNFQFATIFEQRKTNQLLIAGFRNLAQALEGMSNRIEASIGYLGHQISEMSATLDRSVQTIGSGLTENLKDVHGSLVESTRDVGRGVSSLAAS